MVDALTRTQPFLHAACHGEELGKGNWDSLRGWNRHEEDEFDELEQWRLEGEDEIKLGRTVRLMQPPAKLVRLYISIRASLDADCMLN